MSWRTPSNDLGTHVCINLINLVKEHPMLYISSSKKSAPYPKKNRNEINHIWGNIAKETGLSVSDCKRRWKGLKDVYAKIRKRRLQEGVLGFSNKRKWIYEDFMTFMKFPFEKPYQEALENFEEVDCDDWKLEETESNDTAEEIFNDNNTINNESEVNNDRDDDRQQIEEEEGEEGEEENGEIEYLDLDLEVHSVPDSEEYEETSVLEKDDTQLSSENANDIPKNNPEDYKTEIGVKTRYRTIRPKPGNQSNLLMENKNVIKNNNCIVENIIVPVLNVSDLNPSSKIIARNESTLKRKGEKLNCNRSRKNRKVEKNRKKESTSDGVSSTSQNTMKLNNFSNKNRNSRIDSSSSNVISNNNKNQSFLSNSFSVKRNYSNNSVELFFQSMGRTVMSLPLRAQAEIKMEICKIVTKAEIQHSTSQQNNKSDSRNG